MARFLTLRQRQILDFIRDFQRREGISPTHREIRDRFGYSSYGTVHKHLKLLEQKGYLKRHWNQKRGVELTPSAGGRSSSARRVPYFGRIAAGRPIEAIAGDEQVTVPEQLLASGSGRHYVLKVEGDSMVDEGVHDGDFVVVQEQSQARPGQMVVALLSDEVTLKRYFPEGETVRLQPANPRMEPIHVPARDLRLQGIVVGLMRRF
ncbi:MAG: transcriptional repressor LexA [Thermoanaerobaculia bacterium]